MKEEKKLVGLGEDKYIHRLGLENWTIVISSVVPKLNHGQCSKVLCVLYYIYVCVVLWLCVEREKERERYEQKR